MANKKVTGADIELQECGKAARGEYAHPGTPFKEGDPRRAFGWSAVTDVIELRRLYEEADESRSAIRKTLHETQDEHAVLRRQYDELVKKNAENIAECDRLTEDRTELEGQVRDLIEAVGALGRAYTTTG